MDQTLLGPLPRGHCLRLGQMRQGHHRVGRLLREGRPRQEGRLHQAS